MGIPVGVSFIRIIAFLAYFGRFSIHENACLHHHYNYNSVVVVHGVVTGHDAIAGRAGPLLGPFYNLM